MINSRSAALLLALATALLAPPVGAQPIAASTTDTSLTTSTGTSTTALQQSDFKMRIRRKDGDTWVDMSALDQQTFFNQARCECGEKVQIIVDLQSGAATKVSVLKGTAQLMVGPSNCLSSDSAIRANAQCWSAATENKLGNISHANSWAVEVSVRDLFSHRGTSTSTTSDPCSTYLPQKVWFFIDGDGDTNPDINEGASGTDSLSLTLDGEAPSAPTDLTVRGGNEALEITWPAATTADTDLAGYLLFCRRGEDLPVFKNSPYDKQYFTKDLMCGTDTTSSALLDASNLDASTLATSSTETPATPVDPGPLATLDKKYLCSGLISAQTTQQRLTGLQNGAPYVVGLVAVDKSGNPSPISTAYYQTPIPTRDFYREYRDAGGDAEGGYCTLAGRKVRTSALVIGLLGLGIAWTAGRRLRRRSRRGSKILFLLLPLLISAQAQAQAISHDFDDMAGLDASSPESFGSPRYGAFELRFGPYSPNVDSEFSGTGSAPHQRVMGNGNHLMTQFELDWELLHAIGTLGVGVQAGYMSETAKAFKTDAPDQRSGDDTTLRIMPLAALLVYRMDLAAEYWHIPLVPYAKAGLNYTFWSITDGNGNTPEYKNGKGKGGTPGWQAALGISLQLDFLDPSAARGFDSDMGVNHTYVFFEWNHVAADGLGSKNKLHVGDSTWVAGLMLEF